MSESQKGCTSKSQGCREQLIIDHVITNQARRKRRSISMTWIDYQEAYDSISHSWLIHKILEIYRINLNIMNTLRNTMSKWNTELIITRPYI